MSKPTIEVKGRIRHTRSDVVFLIINWILLILCAIVLLYPLLYIIMSSFSAGPTYMRLSLIPTKFSLEGYTAVFEYADIWTGYRNSLLYTAVFTVVSLAMTVCLAYPLSRRDFGGGKYMMLLCMFTMYFSGGLIPTYVLDAPDEAAGQHVGPDHSERRFGIQHDRHAHLFQHADSG